MNGSESTRHADVVSAWRSLPGADRAGFGARDGAGGLAALVRWAGTVLPSSQLPGLLDLPARFVAESLASTAVPPVPAPGRGGGASRKQREWNGLLH